MKTKVLSRRKFLRTAGIVGAGLAAAGLVPTQVSAAAEERFPRSYPTVLA
ncbi:MAG: hypothetical protein DDG58_14815, partial [Ardenticatenia bacterium]